MNTIKTENVGFSTYSVSIPTTVDRQCLTAEDTYHGLTELLSSPTVKVKKKGGVLSFFNNVYNLFTLF